MGREEKKLSKSDTEREYSMKSFWEFAEAWLKEHWGRFLGEQGVLAKGAAFLTTVVILYSNFLFHRYDVGYYHRFFGVPREYLRAAWNSSMTDLLVYAMIAIVRSILILGAVAVLLVFLVAFCVWIHEKSKKTQMIFWVLFVVAAVILVVFMIFWWDSYQMWKFLAGLCGAVFLILTLCLIWQTYQLSLGPEDCSDCGQISCDKEKCKKMKRKRGVRNAMAVFLAVMVIAAAVLAPCFGQNMASLETRLQYISVEESIPQQMDELLCKPQGEDGEKCVWAVIYRYGDNYLAAPCVTGSDEAEIFTKYQCVVPSGEVVVVTEHFQDITINREDPPWENSREDPAEPTEEPTPTTTPTEEPYPTTAPVPTEEPSPTTVPVPTEEPNPTTEPEPTPDPNPVPEPTPEPIPVPVPIPVPIPGPVPDPAPTGCCTSCCIEFCGCCRCTPGLG